MPKQQHNEYFQPIVKTTCECGAKKTQVYSWGEYVVGKWRTVSYCCKSCFPVRVLPRLISHAGECGCRFNLVARMGHSLPDWIRMSDTCVA